MDQAIGIRDSISDASWQTTSRADIFEGEADRIKVLPSPPWIRLPIATHAFVVDINDVAVVREAAIKRIAAPIKSDESAISAKAPQNIRLLGVSQVNIAKVALVPFYEVKDHAT